jgi:polyhydroxyalkanoate synthesis regulator phasin
MLKSIKPSNAVFLGLILLPALALATAPGETIDWADIVHARSPEPAGDEVTLTLPLPGDQIGYETVTRPRMIEVEVGLIVLVDDFSQALADIQGAFKGEDGFIAQLSYIRPYEEPSAGRVIFQVRTDVRDDLVAKISALGEVIQEERNSTDVSQEFYAQERELEDLRARLTALRRELAEETSPSRIQSLERDLADLERQAADLLIANPQLDGKVGLTSVFLTLTEDEGVIPEPGKDLLNRGVSDGYIALMSVVRVIIIVLFVGVPVGLIGFLVYLPLRRVVKKLRAKKAPAGGA